MTELYKIMSCKERVVGHNPFPRVQISETRGHSFKVRAVKSKGDEQAKFFLHTGC